MSCNPNFEAGFGCGVLAIVLVLIICHILKNFRNGAVPVQPFRCPNCNYTEVVVEPIPLARVAP